MPLRAGSRARHFSNQAVTSGGGAALLRRRLAGPRVNLASCLDDVPMLIEIAIDSRTSAALT
jgi:hypothetical protein